MNLGIIKKFISVLLCAVMVISCVGSAYAEILSAVDDFGETEYIMPQEETLTLSQSSAAIDIEESISLRAVLSNGESGGDAIIWKTSDANIASVENGTVYAISPGTAEITATIKSSDVSAVCKITVIDPEALDPFGLGTLEATVFTGNAYGITIDRDDLTWKSSDNSIATVKDGIVTAVSTGVAVITISDSEGKACRFTITVKKAPSDNIKLTSSENTIRAKQTYYMKAFRCGSQILWSSSNEKVATVENGMVYAKKKGVAVISAYTAGGDYVKTCVLTVKGTIPVRFTYTSPNSAPLNSEITLYAVTDKLRTAVKFTVYEGDTQKVIDATEKIEDGNTYIWSATHTFSTAGEHKVTASALYNNAEWASGENAETTAFVTQSESLTECTLEQRRASIEIIDLIANFEGFSSSVYADTLANNIPTLGYGKVIWEGDVFYNDLTKTEARAYLINDINKGSYSKSVTRLLMDNNIKFNQNQYDALVSFSYNVGAGWAEYSDMSDMLIYESVEPTSDSDSDSDSDTDNGPKIGDTVTVRVDSVLNMRSGPGTDYEILKSLYNGTELTLLDTELFNEDWYKVEHSDGTVGYCHRDYLIFKREIADDVERSLANVSIDSIVSEMLQWHKASGSCIAGLLYRRIDELEVFLYSEYNRDGSRNKHGWLMPYCCN